MSDRAVPSVLQLQVASATLEPEEIDELTRRLREELQELDVQSVELAHGGAAPPGAKGMEFAALGALIVTAAPRFLPKIVEVIQAWLTRGADKTVKVKASIGERSVELEYPPALTSKQEMQDLLASLTSALGVATKDAGPVGS
jgi:hypothetical protein